MERVITSEFCKEVGELSPEALKLDRNRMKFILKKKFRNLSGRKRLGLVWMVLDPIVVSLVYLFVFSVLSARTSIVTIFVGITLFRLTQNSLKIGMNSIKDFTGGLKAERVRTRVLIGSMIRYRTIDNFLQSFGVALILLIVFDAPLIGIISFLIISQLIGFLSEGVGMNLAPLAKKVPDLINVVNYILMTLFFASPALYPLSATEGLHYKLNELHPFTYFVETARYFLNEESEILNLDYRLFGFFIFILVASIIRGYSIIDKLRWRMTTWS